MIQNSSLVHLIVLIHQKNLFLNLKALHLRMNLQALHLEVHPLLIKHQHSNLLQVIHQILLVHHLQMAILPNHHLIHHQYKIFFLVQIQKINPIQEIYHYHLEIHLQEAILVVLIKVKILQKPKRRRWKTINHFQMITTLLTNLLIK